MLLPSLRISSFTHWVNRVVVINPKQAKDIMLEDTPQPGWPGIYDQLMQRCVLFKTDFLQPVLSSLGEDIERHWMTMV